MEKLNWRVYVCALLYGDYLGCPIQLTEQPTDAELSDAEAQVFENLGLVVVIDVDENNVATAILI